MAWVPESQLTERFEHMCHVLKQVRPHWKLGASYDGWVAAQHREQPRLLTLVKHKLRQHMQALPVAPGRWHAFAVDGTQLACPRVEKNQVAMGDVGKPDGIPQVSLTCLLHLSTRLPWDFRVGPGTDSERAHLRDMLDSLPPGSLLVADAGFIGYDLASELMTRQQAFLFRVGGNMHLLGSLGYAYEIAGQTVYLWPVEQQQRNQPPLELRLTVVQDENKQPVYLLTNVLETAKLTDEEADGYYRERWVIEVAYRTFKQIWDCAVLRSRTPENCYLELTWRLTGLWMLQLITAREIAATKGDVRRASAAQARKCVQRVLRGQASTPRKRCSLRESLSCCQMDRYVRRRSKASRNYPRKKQHQPPQPPKIKMPTDAQVHKAQALTPQRLRN